MLTAHSHGSASAFSSDTDNLYETPHKAFHLTVGSLDSERVSFCLSFCDGYLRHSIDMNDLFQMEEDSVEENTDRWLRFWDDEQLRGTYPLCALEEFDQLPLEERPLPGLRTFPDQQKRRPRPSRDRSKPKVHPQWIEEDDED
jgi:hypothetical protein